MRGNIQKKSFCRVCNRLFCIRLSLPNKSCMWRETTDCGLALSCASMCARSFFPVTASEATLHKQAYQCKVSAELVHSVPPLPTIISYSAIIIIIVIILAASTKHYRTKAFHMCLQITLSCAYYGHLAHANFEISSAYLTFCRHLLRLPFLGIQSVTLTNHRTRWGSPNRSGSQLLDNGHVVYNPRVGNEK